MLGYTVMSIGPWMGTSSVASSVRLILLCVERGQMVKSDFRELVWSMYILIRSCTAQRQTFVVFIFLSLFKKKNQFLYVLILFLTVLAILTALGFRN